MQSTGTLATCKQFGFPKAAGFRRNRRRRRCAYTLLELLLVMAVLLLLVGIAWPGVNGMYERHRLRSAVEEVRKRLAGSRVKAIDAGLVYQFRYEPGGRNYVILPYQAAGHRPLVGPSAAGALEGASQPLPSYSGQLPETMRFEPADDFQSVLEQLETGGISDIAGPGAAVATSWSAPILFAPDGMATDAAFDVLDEKDRSIRVSVRGLTAAVTVGGVARRTTQ